MIDVTVKRINLASFLENFSLASKYWENILFENLFRKHLWQQ